MNVFMSLTAAIQLLALSSVFVHSKTQRAVIRPLSYTARLDSAGTFHCAVTGSNIISWYVDRIPSRYPSIRNRGIFASPVTSINATWIQSNLTVPATLENDGISINCIALVDGVQTSGISETAVFCVQGPPLPPVNLTLEVSGDQSHLTLRWKSPSGTACSNDSVISMYTVYIFRPKAETCYNTTMREYSIMNTCSDVKFKVTAWDDIGEGTSTTYVIYRHNSTEPETIVPNTMRAVVAFAASGEPTVQLLFQISNRCFHQRLTVDLHLFLVDTWSVCSDFTQQQGPMMLEPTIVYSTVILDIPHLPSNCQVTATIHVQIQNVSNSPSNITFATYGVQDVEISEGSLPNSICATCIFAQGTDVQGCYIHLFEEHCSVVTNISGIRIAREGDILNATTCVDKLESKSSIYHIVVYDIEADGTIDWHNSALFTTASLNFTSSLDLLNADVPSDSISTVIPSNFTMQEELTVFVIAGAIGGGGLLFVVIIAVVILCTLTVRKFHSTTDEPRNTKQCSCDDSGDIEMKTNEIYGQLPQQQVVRNPAYSWWYPS